jgi:hypothetical protein
MKIASAILAVAALGLCAADKEPSTTPISKTESRLMSDRELRSVLLEQLNSIMLPSRPRPMNAAKPINPLEYLFYWTRPHATELPDVCTADSLVFQFKPYGGRGRGPDQLVRVESLSAKSAYAVYWRAAERVDCSKLDPRDGTFFEAERPQQAWDAIVDLEQSVEAARAEHPNVDFVCGGIGQPTEGRSCAEYIAKFTAKGLRSVRACDEHAAGDAMSCLRLDFLYSQLLIYRRDDQPTLSRVRRVELVSRLVLVHERRD